MAHETDILPWLQAAGLHVIEVDGWRTRGSSTFAPRGSVNHHTAGPAVGNHPSLGTLINGRGKPGDTNYLPGPLCNVSLARNLDVYLIAAGKANHAGEGSWRGLVGNSSVWGLEVEHTGRLATEPYPDAEKWDAMYRIHWAFAMASKFDASMVCQHFEWTTRKIDFVAAIGNDFRRWVQDYIDGDSVTEEDDDMANPKMLVWAEGGDGSVWITDWETRSRVTSKSQMDKLLFFGRAVMHDNGMPFAFKQAELDVIPIDEPNKNVDAKTLATEIVNQLPPGSGGVTQAQLEATLSRQQIIVGPIG